MSDAIEKADRPAAGESYFQGTEPFLSVFTQTQVVLSGIRLTFDERVAHNISELVSQIENARRTFVHSGDIVKALQDIARISSSYQQRVQAWESEASRREKGRAVISGEKIAKMKAEHSRVRMQATLGSRAITKLEVELHQLTNQQLQRNVEKSESVDTSEPEDVQPEVTVDQKAVAEAVEKLRRLLKFSFNEALELNYQDFSQTEQKHRRVMTHFAKSAFILEIVWTQTELQTELPQIGEASYQLNRSGAPAVCRDLRIWLIPISSSASKALKIAADEVELVADGRDLDNFRFGIETVDDFSPFEGPLSLTPEGVETVQKIQASCRNKNIDFALGYADLRQLELAQTEIKISVAEQE